MQLTYNFIFPLIKNLFIRLFSMLITITDACITVSPFHHCRHQKKFQVQSSRREAPVPR